MQNMSRRLALLLAMVCGFATAARAQDHIADTVLVINSGEASLSVIDLATHTERTRIPVLREPHHWAMSPDGHDLLIGDSAANEVLFLDPVSFALKRRLTIPDPYQLSFTPDGKYLVVAGLLRDQVDVYDSRTYALVKRFPLKSMPSHIDFSPDSAFAYVTLQSASKAAALDLRSMTVAWIAPAGNTPAGVMYLGGRLIVADMGSDGIMVLNPRDGATERHITTARGAHQLFLSPDRKILYVNNRIDSCIVALDATTLAHIRTYRVPGGPDDMIFTPDGHIWTTLRFAAKVGMLDPKTGDLQTFPVGRSPHGIFIQGATNSGGGH
jgi:YVTN family beta-propeller protein